MKILIPFTPHLAYECLEILGEKDTKNWPTIDKKLILKEKIKLAIQINGKTREIVEVSKGIDQDEVIKICEKMPKIKTKIESNVKKTIFVKDRIINFIVKV